MIGQINPLWKKVNVVGGGISGMLIADHLSRSGYEVTLYEKSNRLGGLIQTKDTPFGIAESAAHSFMVTPVVRTWLEELGVKLLPVKPGSKSRFVYRKGKLKRLPLGLWELVKTATRGFRPEQRELKAEASLAEWTQNYLGQPALKHLITPFCYGVYATEPSELVASIAFPRLVVPQGKSLLGHFLFRSKTKSEKPQFNVPENGMGSVIQLLERRLQKNLGHRLKLNTVPVPQDLDQNTNWVLALPAQAAAEWLQKMDPQTARALSRVRYSPLISVTVFCENRGFDNVPCGVGALSSYEVRDPVLGVLFNSSSFSGRVKNQAHSSFTVMLGGTRNPRWLMAGESEIQAEVKHVLRQWLGYRGEPLHMEIHRWNRAVPIYNEALLDAWNSANQGLFSGSGRVLFANFTGQVSIRGLLEELLRKVPG